MSNRALPAFALLAANYPTDSDSPKVIQQLGGELTQSWVGPNRSSSRKCRDLRFLMAEVTQVLSLPSRI
jgi:hypothetical protein